MQSAPKPPTGRQRDYVPSADPGSRLPQMKIRALSITSSKVFSTLDLVSGDRAEFLLLIAKFLLLIVPQDSSYKLAKATIKAAKKYRVHIEVAVIWPEDTTVGPDLVVRSVSSPLDSYVNVVEVKRSRSSPSWWDLCKMNDRGAILVRPDEHIAWRTRSEVEGDPVNKMEKVFAVVLGSSRETSLVKRWSERLQLGLFGLCSLTLRAMLYAGRRNVCETL